MATPSVPPSFGQVFSNSLATSLGGAVVGLAPSSTTTSQSGTSKQYLDLSPEGYNKIIRDVLASDAGLASLATGENLSGGYGSSVKAQLAQDLVLNIAGEMAKLTAPTVSETSSKSKTKKKTSVICTELNRQGLLSDSLYEAGIPHFLNLPEETVAGYRSWADKIVPLMQISPRLSKFLNVIVQSRYRMITGGKFEILGAATIYLGQPICFVIGSIILRVKGNHGNLSATA